VEALHDEDACVVEAVVRIVESARGDSPVPPIIGLLEFRLQINRGSYLTGLGRDGIVENDAVTVFARAYVRTRRSLKPVATLIVLVMRGRIGEKAELISPTGLVPLVDDDALGRECETASEVAFV